MSHQIHWSKLDKTITAENGQSILEAAVEAGIPLDHSCGGFCVCSTCHIRVIDGMENISPIDEEEQDRLDSSSGTNPKSRLACQSKVFGNITVEIP